MHVVINVHGVLLLLYILGRVKVIVEALFTCFLCNLLSELEHCKICWHNGFHHELDVLTSKEEVM